MKFFFGCCILIVSSEAVKLPSNFKKCNRKQPDFKGCLIEAVEYGVSQLDRPYKRLNLPSIEPLEVLEMSGHVRRTGIDLEEHFYNCKFFGLSKTRVKKFNFDLNQRFMHLETVFPKIDSQCIYEPNGTILGIPIHGRGESQLHCTNFHVVLHITYDEVKKDNKTYCKIATSKIDGKPEHLALGIQNLFNGDEEATKQVVRLINENWSDLYDFAAKDNYLEMPNQFFKQLAAKFFSKLSLEDLID